MTHASPASVTVAEADTGQRGCCCYSSQLCGSSTAGPHTWRYACALITEAKADRCKKRHRVRLKEGGWLRHGVKSAATAHQAVQAQVKFPCGFDRKVHAVVQFHAEVLQSQMMTDDNVIIMRCSIWMQQLLLAAMPWTNKALW